jgi:hypothetical protein
VTTARKQPLILVVKDHEPHVEIIFFLWGIAFLARRMFVVHREQRLLETDFVQLRPGERILPDGAMERMRVRCGR